MPPFPASQASLKQLIALNEEIASLVRAGIPLEKGLSETGSSLPGILGRWTKELGEAMEQGFGLSEALARQRVEVPLLYRAVVEAGLRSGRLEGALESVAQLARQYQELRSALGRALWYPMTVLLFGFLLFLFYIEQVLPQFVATYSSLRLPLHGFLRGLAGLGSTSLWWGPVVPALLVMVVIWWVRLGRASLMDAAGTPLRWVPWMNPILRGSACASYARTLSVMVNQQVPLHEAAVLAAASVGDKALREGAVTLSRSLERGESLAAGLSDAAWFPPMLRWLMITGERQGRLDQALQHAAELYRARVLYQAELVQVALPVLLLVAIGAGTTLLYALTLFAPMSALLRDLAVEGL